MWLGFYIENSAISSYIKVQDVYTQELADMD